MEGTCMRVHTDATAFLSATQKTTMEVQVMPIHFGMEDRLQMNERLLSKYKDAWLLVIFPYLCSFFHSSQELSILCVPTLTLRTMLCLRLSMNTTAPPSSLPPMLMPVRMSCEGVVRARHHVVVGKESYMGRESWTERELCGMFQFACR